MFAKQAPMRAQVSTLLFPSFFLAGRFLGGLGARTALGQGRLFGGYTLALTGAGAAHRCDDLLDPMALANLLRHLAKDLTEGGGITLRAIVGATPQRQVAHI